MAPFGSERAADSEGSNCLCGFKSNRHSEGDVEPGLKKHEQTASVTMGAWFVRPGVAASREELLQQTGRMHFKYLTHKKNRWGDQIIRWSDGIRSHRCHGGNTQRIQRKLSASSLQSVSWANLQSHRLVWISAGFVLKHHLAVKLVVLSVSYKAGGEVREKWNPERKVCKLCR